MTTKFFEPGGGPLSGGATPNPRAVRGLVAPAKAARAPTPFERRMSMEFTCDGKFLSFTNEELRRVASVTYR